MVNWKSKYLEMKLKYINAKHKGGMLARKLRMPSRNPDEPVCKNYAKSGNCRVESEGRRCKFDHPPLTASRADGDRVNNTQPPHNTTQPPLSHHSARQYTQPPLPLEEDIERIYQKVIFENHVKLIKDFIEYTWYGNNYNIPMELKKDVEEINEKIKSWYAQSTYIGPGYSLNSSKIKENSEKLDFNLLEDVVEQMNNIGLNKNEYIIWDGTFNDE